MKVKIKRRVQLEKMYEFVELESRVGEKKAVSAIKKLEALAIEARKAEVYPG